LFVVSGTMANELAIRVHCLPGDEVLMHRRSHPFLHEAGAPAALAGATIRPLDGERGLIAVETLRAALRPERFYMSRQRLLCVENTHNHGGGTVWPLDLLSAVARTAHEAGLAVHLDGARIFNASIASGVPVREYAAQVDTISFCLSKGLGAPIGSMLCGPRALIALARRYRHQQGGSWRQAGVLAAAGLYALDHHVERLADDHRRARDLAAAIEGSRVARLLAPVETNIVLFAPARAGLSAPDLRMQLQQRGVFVSPVDPDTLRAVTHLDVDDDGIRHAIQVFSEL